jgi:hypothetical protein
VREALERMRPAVDDCLSAPTLSLSCDELLSCLDDVSALMSRMAAVQARLVSRIEASGAARALGASSTRALVRNRLRLSPYEAKRVCDLAEALDRLELLETAVADGRVNPGQAASIARSLDELPSEIGREAHAKAEAHLVDLAAQFDPADLSTLGRRLVQVVDPEWAQRFEADALRREEERAYAARGLSLVRDHLTGLTKITGLLDSEGAAVVHAVLDPLSAPGATAKPRLIDADGLPAIVDDRTPRQRRADALIDALRLVLDCGRLPNNGGDRPQVSITVGFDPLTRALGVGTLDTGVAVSPETARRLGCDANVLPAVMSGHSVPLDLGREKRLWTGPARRAIYLRDRGCAFPGCDRPPSWTQIHHVAHWADGGETNQDNGVALCGHHHRVVHQHEWRVVIAVDGLPSFIPPAWIDKHQRPVSRRCPDRVVTPVRAAARAVLAIAVRQAPPGRSRSRRGRAGTPRRRPHRRGNRTPRRC